MPSRLFFILLVTIAFFAAGCSRKTDDYRNVAKNEKTIWQENPRIAEPSLELRQEAEEGNSDKQYELAQLYLKLGESNFHSQYVTASNQSPSIDQQREHNKLRIEIFGKAEQWFIKAAEQDHVDAQFQLVHLYSSKIRSALLADSNLDKDIHDRMRSDWKRNKEQRQMNLAEATKWCRRAANRGLARAQFELGNILCGASIATQGLNHKMNPAAIQEAYQWYLKAAEQGHQAAAYQMAQLYRSDRHKWVDQAVEVEPDDTQSMTWLLVATKLHEQSRFANSRSPYSDAIKRLKRKLSSDQFKAAEESSIKLLQAIEQRKQESA